jgi:hypothetical protein
MPNPATTPPPRNTRRVIAPAALTLVLAALAAGCSSPAASSASSSASSSAPPSATSPSAAASASGTPATVATATPASTAASAPASSPSSPAAAGGAPACPTSSLAVRTGTSEGAAGSTYTELDFTNVSGTACSLYGYPGVSFTGGAAHATQIGAAATENASPARQLITLAPGAVAGALLRIADAANFPASTCHSVTAKYLRIYPPNQEAPLYLAFTSPTCSTTVQILTISVVQPGAGNAS